MRILKYILLLILLFLVGLTVFIITQKGDYSITRSKIIKTPRTTVFNFVNDYRNWETFSSWSEDDGKTQFQFPKNTSGKGASCTWDGNSTGKATTLETKENLSIKQKMVLNETETEGNWTFKDTLGKTKVTWQTKGSMSVMMKIKAFLNGGIDNIIGDVYEKSLYKLDRTLDYELNTYNIKVNGIVNKPETFYICETINSKPEKVTKNIKIMLPKMIDFFVKNKMVMHGKPFVRYNSFDEIKQINNFSVGIAIKDSINIMEGSEFSSGKIESFSAVKATLTGDYSHIEQANQKVLDYLFENNLKRNFAVLPYQFYIVNFLDEKHPSKWKTEVYYPIYQKEIPVKPIAKPKPVAVVPVQNP
jgi:hypothetical protein